MSSGDKRNYRLTPSALQDLDDIWRYSAETWSVEQADKYIDELAAVFESKRDENRNILALSVT